MAYRRDEMWSEGRYDYERVPRERLPPRIHPDEDYHRVVNVVPKKPPLLERPGDGSYSRYDDYGHPEYRDYEEGRSFTHDRRSGPPHRGVRKDESGYRWPRDDHPVSRQPDYRDIRDGFRRKSFYPSHYMRERSPHKRDSPFFRESPGSRRDSPHSRSGSSVSSRSYSPERSKSYPFHQPQHSRSMSSLHKRNISSQQVYWQNYSNGTGSGEVEADTFTKQKRCWSREKVTFVGKERTSVQSTKTSRDGSPSGSTAVPTSKQFPGEARVHSPEVKGRKLDVHPPHCPEDPELHHFMVAASKAALDLHVPYQPLLVDENKVQHGTSPRWPLYHLEDEVVINTFQEPPGLPVPSCVVPLTDTEVLDKSNRLSEKELAEAASKWAAEKSEKADESNLPEITECDAGSSTALYVEQTEETETHITDTTELYEDGQLLGRSKAIATKTKEIEQVYRQDCETFGMVVKMLIDKDPSLEKSIQFALRQNLHEIGERCIEELKHFIAQYDAANQDLSESYKEASY